MSSIALTEPQEAVAKGLAREIGARLREARVISGLTVKDAAAALGMWPSSLVSLEHGYQRNPKLGNLLRVLNFYGMTLVVAPSPEAQ